jgi:hypothetical protein
MTMAARRGVIRPVGKPAWAAAVFMAVVAAAGTGNRSFVRFWAVCKIYKLENSKCGE